MHSKLDDPLKNQKKKKMYEICGRIPVAVNYRLAADDDEICALREIREAINHNYVIRRNFQLHKFIEFCSTIALSGI